MKVESCNTLYPFVSNILLNPVSSGLIHLVARLRISFMLNLNVFYCMGIIPFVCPFVIKGHLDCLNHSPCLRLLYCTYNMGPTSHGYAKINTRYDFALGFSWLRNRGNESMDREEPVSPQTRATVGTGSPCR